uniref:DnaJ homolog subfamily C member 1 n=1 Tax=Plectus sambesii TaxID=2011161 RepID=A0A914VPH9_9BILA
MGLVVRLIGLSLLQATVCSGFGWTTDDLALFDLVDEVQQNFYELFGINKDATLGEVKKAYRRLSLQWHPDRNSDEGATVMFRKVAAVYEVLKTEEGRQKYNEILENGLPDWRQPIYYYRHVRKMPWWETLVLILLIASVGHYLMLWGAYFERRLALSESVTNRLKKKEKQLKRKNQDVDDLIEAELQEQLADDRPKFTRLLPILLAKSLYSGLRALPGGVRDAYLTWQQSRQPVIEEPVVPREPRRLNVQRVDFEYSVATDIAPVTTADRSAIERLEQEAGRSADVNKFVSSEWTFEELANLVKLSTQKFPAGTVNRWERIAEALNRRPDAVTTMIGKLKNMDPKDYQKLCDGPAPSDNLVTNNRLPSSSPVNEPTVADDSEAADDVWSQTQQKLFEQSLQQFPKGTAERWEKISRCVPGKTKEECMLRYKRLAELVRQRKTKSSH